MKGGSQLRPLTSTASDEGAFLLFLLKRIPAVNALNALWPSMLVPNMMISGWSSSRQERVGARERAADGYIDGASFELLRTRTHHSYIGWTISHPLSQWQTSTLSSSPPTTSGGTYPSSSGSWLGHSRRSGCDAVQRRSLEHVFQRILMRIRMRMRSAGLVWAGRSLDWEVVIVDDASPDGTQQVAEQLQGIFGEDHVVRVIAPTTFTEAHAAYVPVSLSLTQVLRPRSGKLGLG